MAAMEMAAMGIAAMVVPSEGAGARGGAGCVGKDVVADTARIADMTGLKAMPWVAVMLAAATLAV